MIEVRRAAIRAENGHQVIVLPDDIHFDAAEVSIMHNMDTGELTVRGMPRSTSWEEFVAHRDRLAIAEEEWQLFDDAIRESRQNAQVAVRKNLDDPVDES